MIPCVQLAAAYKGVRVSEFKLAAFDGEYFTLSIKLPESQQVDGIVIQRNTCLEDKLVTAIGIMAPPGSWNVSVKKADAL